MTARTLLFSTLVHSAYIAVHNFKRFSYFSLLPSPKREKGGGGNKGQAKRGALTGRWESCFAINPPGDLGQAHTTRFTGPQLSSCRLQTSQPNPEKAWHPKLSIHQNSPASEVLLLDIFCTASVFSFQYNDCSEAKSFYAELCSRV